MCAGRLSDEGIDAVAAALVSAGNAEWADAGRTTLRLFYKAPAEWAALILAHATAMAFGGQVLSLYELRCGSAGAGTAFEGLDADTLLRALKVLEGQGKVDVFPRPALDETGVRFKV